VGISGSEQDVALRRRQQIRFPIQHADGVEVVCNLHRQRFHVSHFRHFRPDLFGLGSKLVAAVGILCGKWRLRNDRGLRIDKERKGAGIQTGKEHKSTHVLLLKGSMNLKPKREFLAANYADYANGRRYSNDTGSTSTMIFVEVI